MIGKGLIFITLALALAFAAATVGHAQVAGASDHAYSELAAGGDDIEVVAPGDTLFRIALRRGTTVEALMRANQLTAPDRIVVGQSLRIPPAGGVAAAPGVSGIGGAPAAPAYSMPAGAADAVRYPSGRRIVIDLSDQTLTAFDNGAVAGSFIVSTGKPTTPTVLGNFSIYSRYLSQDMSGPGYYAPGVPFVQYFWSGYSVHGTYWHTDFGTPVSHGCINMQTPEAEWLWGWASIGTPVIVQP